MIENPAKIAAEAVADIGSCACRELRNELADAARSCRLEDAQVYLSAACIVCGGKQRRTTAADLGYIDAQPHAALTLVGSDEHRSR